MHHPQDGGCFARRTVIYPNVCGHADVVVHSQRSEDNWQESFLSLSLVRSGVGFRSSGQAASTFIHCPNSQVLFLEMFLFMCIGVLPVSISVHMCAGQKGALEAMELELRLVVSCFVGAQNLLEE